MCIFDASMVKKNGNVKKKTPPIPKVSGFVVAASVLFLTVCIVGFYFLYPSQKTLTYYTESDEIAFKSGDLILRRGKSFISQMVLLNDKKSEYSHIGIVVLQDSTPWVVHAVPGEAKKGEPEYIKMETVKSFLCVDKSADFAVFSPKEKYRNAAEKAAQHAREYYKQKILFDASFSLEDDSRLYCTELIWRAYQKAGINLAEQYTTVKSPLFNGDIIFPSDLFLNPIFIQIFPITTN